MSPRPKNAKVSQPESVPAPSHPPVPCNLGNGIWQQGSWSNPEEVYQQDLNERTCTCQAGEKGLWCRHLTQAMMASFTLQVRHAQSADGPVLRRLLKRGTRRDRPDIEMAMLLVCWQEARADWNRTHNQPDPTDETPPPGSEPEQLSEEDYAAACHLLSEGRVAA